MSNTEWIYSFFTALSFVFLLCYSGYSFFAYRKVEQSKRAFSVTVFYTAGVFIAAVLVFIPVYYINYDFGDPYSYIRPVLLSFHNSLRVFILDGEFDTIRDAAEGLCVPLHTMYTLYCAILYVVAPVLTLSTVLSFFKNFNSEIRYRFCGNKKIYIFSELNDGSLALAKSIRKKPSGNKAVIVFTDVYEKNEETNHELALEAYNIDAICLKKDVTHLNISSKKGNVEIFLIGENESENVSQASLLTERFNKENKKQNIKIFVFASGKESGYIIDSLNYDSLLRRAADAGFDDNTFKIRRVNSIKQLVWRTIPSINLFEHCENKTISVMIAGIGSFGTEFFKMLIWYCQMEGYFLELNIFDKSRKNDTNEKYSIKSLLARQCPELFQKNPCTDDGDAVYDIRCYDGIDFSNDSFEKLWNDPDTCERLKRTSLVLVALGDDDTNIETAVYLRSLFDRKNQIVATKDINIADEHPSIYSIVYDGTKSGTVTNGGDECLRNYKKIPYHIHFIGSIEQQYDYDNIYDFKTETDAFRYHVEWIKVSDALVKKAQEMHYDSSKLSEIEHEKIDDLKNAQADYEHYEYYRLSSMAKAIHKRSMAQYCESVKKTEHSRWNAYMRTEGYSYGTRADRALVHNDLVDWKTLKGRNNGEEDKD